MSPSVLYITDPSTHIDTQRGNLTFGSDDCLRSFHDELRFTTGPATSLSTGFTTGTATSFTTGFTTGSATSLTTGFATGPATSLTTGFTTGPATSLTTGFATRVS